ncbi:SDR family NAD(P)-dependent oxidoreductase [Streptacidiphilus albus]|uniref:SDR family NAD(P)-dependent oxidoreductase n=1 Tax=Streptacidiphilus albus TaxID=105425 RepID=UPI000ACB3615|nr:glucose 1-dehydrogenase [Streptacidiphilus albus]
MNTRMLEGKVAVITGASSGIGAAAARLFAAEGAAVVLMARRADRVRDLAREITEAGGSACAAPGDVASPRDAARAVTVALDAYGRLDCAFNNAGYATAGVPLHEIGDEVFERTMAVNVAGVWNCLRAQVPAMLKHGGGSIVNTSSVAGLQATGASAAYIAAKHAVIGLTRAAASDYARQGIRVNALVVGSTLTEMMHDILAAVPELEEEFLSNSLQQRMAAPSEVAQAAAWLCSDRSSFVTGTAMPVDGGATAM